MSRFQLAGAAVQAQLHALGQAGGEKDLIAPDHRRDMAVAGDRLLPRDVIRGAPFGGNVFLEADAITGGAAPTRPVFSEQGKRRD